jgi:hypothetical protein
MKPLLIVLLLLSCVTIHAQSKEEAAIAKVLDNQSGAWNRGNLEEFMVGYWKSDSLMFIGSRGITYGWNNTLANYKKSYPDTAAMGKLNFTLLKIKQLSNEYYQIIGKWHLQRSAGDLSGHFTLLFQKINGEWVIVADHSS